MNALQKLGCRTFQTFGRLAMPVLPYRSPILLKGMDGIPAALLAEGVDRVLLVTGPNIRRRGLTRPLEELLARTGVPCAVYDGTVENPTTENACEAANLYKEENCKGIIALGGGSPMDCAKAAGAILARPDLRVEKMAGLCKVRKPIPPLIAIPTTAGSGSETTLAAVITDTATHQKRSISDFCLIPKYVLLDPALTVGLPPAVTAATGLDALTHAVEAYIGRSTTAFTREAAKEAVALVFRYLPRACEDGDDLEARERMLYASFRAGEAFTRSYVGYVHALSHALSAAYGLAHGRTNAILLPVVLRAFGASAEKKLRELAEVIGEPDFLTALDALERRLHIPTVIPELRAADIPALAQTAAGEANPLYPVPRLMDAKELEALYRQVLAEG